MLDWGLLRGIWSRQGDRFHAPDQRHDYYDFYTMPSELITQVQKRPQQGFSVQTINLGTAGQLEIPTPGTAIVAYGSANDATHSVDTTIFLELYLEQMVNVGVDFFPLKHNRGFIGPFSRVVLRWPAQTNGMANRYADIVIYKGFMRPWIDGGAAT